VRAVRGGDSSEISAHVDWLPACKSSSFDSITKASPVQFSGLVVALAMAMASIDLGDADVWDDSALVASWDAAAEEYKVGCSFVPVIFMF